MINSIRRIYNNMGNITKSTSYNKKKILLESIITILIRIIGAVSGVLFIAFIGRNFGAEGVGIFQLSISILRIPMIFINFGMDLTIIKYVSIFKAYNAKKSIDRLEKKTMFFSSSMAVICIAIFFLNNFLSFIRLENNLNTFTLIMSISLFFYGILNIWCSVLKGLEKFFVANLFEATLGHILNFIYLISFIFILSYKSLLAIPISYLFSMGTVTVLLFLYKKKNENQRNEICVDDFKFKKFIKTASSLLLVSSMNYILSTIDILMISYWCSDKELGIYTVGTKITLLFSLILTGVNSVLGSKFSALYKKNKFNEIREILFFLQKIFFVVSLVLTILLSLFSDEILFLFGKEFLIAKNILYISLLGQFFVLAKGPATVLLIMMGYEEIHKKNTLFCAICNVILNAILIPEYGVLGASLSTAISLILKNIYISYIIKRKLNNMKSEKEKVS